MRIGLLLVSVFTLPVLYTTRQGPTTFLQAVPAASQSVAAADVASYVVGVAIATDGPAEVTMNAVPHASGAWGTDYLTVAHGMRSGAKYSITVDGTRFEPATIVPTHCSGIAHGTEALILRVAAPHSLPTPSWGNPAELKPGDELQILPWRHRPVRIHFVHRSYHESGLRENIPSEWESTLVADGQSQPGFSGAPWVRNGRIYGVHKGQDRPKKDSDRIVVLAESAGRIRECLKRAGYEPPQ